MSITQDGPHLFLGMRESKLPHAKKTCCMMECNYHYPREPIMVCEVVLKSIEKFISNLVLHKYFGIMKNKDFSILKSAGM